MSFTLTHNRDMATTRSIRSKDLQHSHNELTASPGIHIISNECFVRSLSLSDLVLAGGLYCISKTSPGSYMIIRAYYLLMFLSSATEGELWHDEVDRDRRDDKIVVQIGTSLLAHVPHSLVNNICYPIDPPS